MTNIHTQKAIIITGAAGGIGYSLCETFSNNGYFVVAIVRSQPEQPIPCDKLICVDLNTFATQNHAYEKLKEDIKTAAQGYSIKALINNAAVQILGKTADLTASDLTLSFNVNVLAPFRLTQLLLEELTLSQGSVLNIGTVHAQATKREFVAYATTKTAMHGLTRSLAIDLGADVRVNTLAPAATLTPMLKAGFAGKDAAFNQLKNCHPLERIATVEEVSKAALFLCSDDASFISGATLYVDGGILSRLHDPA